ncbi:MAG TPA: glycerophosphoryl diester phosphodiesterase [Opitutaceae bacterium]
MKSPAMRFDIRTWSPAKNGVNRRACALALAWLCVSHAPLGAGPSEVTLRDSATRLEWTRQADGWRLASVVVRTPEGEFPAGAPVGSYTLLYSREKPDATPVPFHLPGHQEPFPEPAYIYNTKKWADATVPVALNQAGEAHTFFPKQLEQTEADTWTFREDTALASVSATWRLDRSTPGDVEVALTVTAKQEGYFSIATPTLARVAPAELKWAVVPGYFQGREINPNFVLSLVYGHGLPDRPVLARERGVSTLASILSHQNGVTLAVAAEPGTAADPWPDKGGARGTWKLGLSHMNRRGEFSPTLYHPVLGEEGSKLAAGDARTFRFRYVLRRADWFAALRHVITDVYGLPEFLALKQPERSLSDRLQALHGYVTDDQTSLWRTEEFGGVTLGAQAYLGGIVGSDKDGMKNSDYGAMWMLAKLTGDPKLTRDRLPFARNFKLVQQGRDPGFLQGAALGQYYLSKSRRFTEEWGEYVEPVALTYYVLLDLGNILLFTPGDQELRERLRLGADRLLSWQQEDGHWEVAYDHKKHEPLFTETPDLRPTFYGLLVAYRILGDEKYLQAARRGADWLLQHAVDPGRFLGVCGDNRFAPDFATAQISQALLDLHDLTGHEPYREAAIATARFYVTSIFTHPLATAEKKSVKGKPRFDWEITQAGLGFEHGGSIGTAGGAGPILLATHAGLFIRMHALTGEPLFRDLARAAALARDAFVNPETSVASYYWNGMDRGAGPFPHHAWWQIGWITDYLISEAAMRSAGQVYFPAGFITPKVGPHRCYGFAPGRVLGTPADLAWGRLTTSHPAIDTILARATEGRRLFAILLNDRAEPTTATVQADVSELSGGAAAHWTSATLHTGEPNGGHPIDPAQPLTLPAYGWAVMSLNY